MRACRQQRSVAGAFTLVELLVTILVIAGLLFLLLPVVSRISEKSLVAKCQQQLRQLGVAGILFATDRDGRLPDRGDWRSATNTRSILPYLGIPLRLSSQSPAYVNSVLTCPAIQRSIFRTETEWNSTYSINQYATGSDVTQDDTWQTQVFNRGVPVRLGNVKSPAQQAFFMDGTAVKDSYGSRFSVFQDPSRLMQRVDYTDGGWKTPYIHQDSINVVFLDGHLEVLTLERAELELIGAANPSSNQYSPRILPFWGTQK